MRWIGFVAVAVGFFLYGLNYGHGGNNCQKAGQKPAFSTPTPTRHAARTPVQQRPVHKDRVREIPVMRTNIFFTPVSAQEPNRECSSRPAIEETQTEEPENHIYEKVPPVGVEREPIEKKRSTTKWNVGVFLDRGHIGADISVGNDRRRGGYNSRNGGYYEDRNDDRYYGGNSCGSNRSNSYRYGGMTRGGNEIPPSAPPIGRQW